MCSSDLKDYLNSVEIILTREDVSELTFAWGTQLAAPLPSAPVVGRGMVFFASGGNIAAINDRTGLEIWSHLSCSGVDTVQPALGKHGLFVGDGGGDLAGYDPATGTQLWCDDEGGSITSAPATNKDTIYITNGSDVVAVHQGTGAQRWRFTPEDFSVVTTRRPSRAAPSMSPAASLFLLSTKEPANRFGARTWARESSLLPFPIRPFTSEILTPSGR